RLACDLWIDGRLWYTPPLQTHRSTRDPHLRLGHDAGEGTFAISRQEDTQVVDHTPTLRTDAAGLAVVASPLSCSGPDLGPRARALAPVSVVAQPPSPLARALTSPSRL
ncbi:MAG: hypothetical protein WCA82_10095, partial [Jiangellales bacterium]